MKTQRFRRACPEPTKSCRRDGWTPQRQLAFLDALARTHSITKAARAAGMSRESAYRLRARDPHGLFAAAWARALEKPALSLSKGPALSLSKGHKVVAPRPRPKRRQAFGLGWNSIKGHELLDPLLSCAGRPKP